MVLKKLRIENDGLKLIAILVVDNQYAYDGMNRLANGEGVSEVYDELSNLVAHGSNSYIYQDPSDGPLNDQMRLALFNDGALHEYSYDDNGNPVAISNRFTSLSYDNLNALRQIVHAQTDNYWNDAFGLRVKKTEDAMGTWKITYTMFEGDNPIMQEVYTAAGRLQVTFNIIVAGKIFAQYTRVYPSTDTVVYFYLDSLDSRKVILSSAPAVIDRYRYSPWGAATQEIGSDYYESFTGKDFDASGLIYFNARFYDPLNGRFLTEDPSRKGVNWYAYCENDPVNRRDQTGLEDNILQHAWNSIVSFFIPQNDSTVQSAGLPSAVSPAQLPADQIMQRAEAQLGKNYEHYGDGYTAFVPANASGFDCSQFTGHVSNKPTTGSGEYSSSPYYAIVNAPSRGDTAVWRAISPTGKQEGHTAIVTGETGNRALIHADLKGVRYSSDYLKAYYESKGYTGITIQYYRPK